MHTSSLRISHTVIALAIAVLVLALAVVSAPKAHAQSAQNCAVEAAKRTAEMREWIRLYNESENKWGQFIKAVARANHAPSTFIWDHVAPGIAQGPNIPDSLDGQFILRVDLYYAHYQAELVREACRALNCRTYSLPAGYESAKPALDAYVQAVEAMPTFSGPGGMNTPGPKRMMSMHDADALQKQIDRGFCEDSSDRTQGGYGDASDEGAQLIAAIGRCETPSIGLRRGQSGENVRRLQNFLMSRGHLSEGNASGFFGRMTEQAVQRFQQERGLVSTGTPSTTGFGRVGNRTLALIRSICGTPGNANNDVRPNGRNENRERNENNSNRTPADIFDSWYRHDQDDTIIGSRGDDLCSNIDDVQLSIPAGMRREGGRCVDDGHTPDTCLDGTNSCVGTTTTGYRPSLQEFLTAARSTDTARASSLLYGVIGSAKDIRDWHAIMSANDPFAAACQATKNMYNSHMSSSYMRFGAVRVSDWQGSPTKTVLANTTNFMFYKEILSNGVTHYGLFLTDDGGYLLTSPANTDVLSQHLANYCFDRSQLTSLQSQLDAINFNLTGLTSWPRGFIGGNGTIATSTVSIMTQTFYRGLYTCVLNREGSNAEVQSWVALHQRSVEGLRNGFRGFVNSTEYANKHTTDTQFVNMLYTCVLGRTAGSDATYWIDQLARGTSRSVVLEGILNATEFTQIVVPRWNTLASPTAMRATDAQVASVLSAVQDAINAIMAYFKPKPAPADAGTAGTSSAPQKWGPTAPTNTQPAAAPTGTLHAVFKGTAIPDVMNVTKEIAQKLCRPDATCTWNGEPIVSEGYAPTPGGYTITFTMPAPASKQTLASGTGYTFEISDNSSMTGAVTQDSYRLYFAKYTSKVGPDVIYQAKLSGVNRTLSGAVQLKWDGMIINPDGSTAKLPAGFYYAGAVNAKNALKGGSTGSITVTQ